MKKNTAIVAALAIAFTAITVMQFAPSETIYHCPDVQQQGLRDSAIFILRPTDVEKYDDLIKYVEVMEGDTVLISVFEPSYPDPGNDHSTQ
jgi:hypothetical protein